MTSTSLDQWWHRPVRMFQHLLREQDAAELEPARLVAEVRSAGCNAMIAMGGGFSAWYPTTLTCQEMNPYMKGDLLGGVLETAQVQDVRVLVRMDISKGRAAWLDRNPDWFTRRTDGSPNLIWEMPQVCATGPLWQSDCFEILDEILGRYQVDGFFFNYFTVGRCWCQRCRALVREATGADVPPPGVRTPAYEHWRQNMLADYTRRLRHFIRERQAGAALVPYHHVRDGWDYNAMAEAADIVSAQVSNPVVVNPVDPQPQWTHWAAEEALMATAAKPTTPALLVQTGSAFFASRQTAMPQARLVRNLMQAAAYGASTCPAINGLMAQDDPRNIAALLGVGDYLERQAEWYQGLSSVARIAVVRSEDSIAWGPDQGRPAGNPAHPGTVAEFRGILSMLSDLRRPFDLLLSGRLSEEVLSRYAAVVLPAVSCLREDDAAVLDAYVAGGGLVLATADLGACDADGHPRSAPVLASVPALPGEFRRVSGGYFALASESMRTALGGIPHIGADGEFWSPVDTGEDLDGADLRVIGPFSNNAPEFTVVRGPGEAPGLVRFPYQQGELVWLPWRLGALYETYGLADYAVVLDQILTPAAGPAPVASNAPSAVEFILRRHASGLVLHMLNDAAPQNRPLVEATPIAGFTVRVRTSATTVWRLDRDEPLASRRDGAELTFEMPRLDVYAAVVLPEP
jgi:hypothetical protein